MTTNTTDEFLYVGETYSLRNPDHIAPVINTTDEWLWTDWDGGECPIPDAKRGDWKYRLRSGKELEGGAARVHGWRHIHGECDIIAYAIRNPNYVAAVPVDYPALLKMTVEALEAYDEYLEVPQDRGGKNGPKGLAFQKFINGKNTTLAAIRKAGVK